MAKIENFLKIVFKTNEFYKTVVLNNHIDNYENINLYPILTRKLLQENRYNIFSKGYETLYYNQQLISQSSSGSSGIPVCVYWDPKDYYYSMRLLWRKRLDYYGIHPYQKYIKFTLNSVPGDEKKDNEIIWQKESLNVLNINRTSLQNNTNYKQLLRIIEDFKPEWIYIQPYVLKKIIMAYETYNITPPSSISYIESVGEILPPELKEKAINFFNVPVANLYGSEEMNGIAYECPFHQMHIMSDNVYVECKNATGIHHFGKGEAIITNLVNKAMPLIRYNQGDIITLENLPNPCPCGSSEPVISKIIGREYENIKIGEFELNPYILLSVMTNVNNQFDNVIACYRFVYNKSDKKLVCFIELAEHKSQWFDSLKNEILSILNTTISPLTTITIEIYQQTEINNKNGKKHKILEICK